jgi:aminoglycoside 3-N-acetyltransferase I
MNYTLERLSENNISAMRSVNLLFSDVFNDKESYDSKLPSDEYLNIFLTNPNNIVVVAMNDQKIIGGIVAYVLEKFEMERREVFIYDLAVMSTYQRQGIGKALINHVRDIAKEVGAYVVFVQADENDEAISFYESLNPSVNIRTRNFDFKP